MRTTCLSFCWTDQATPKATPMGSKLATGYADMLSDSTSNLNSQSTWVEVYLVLWSWCSRSSWYYRCWWWESCRLWGWWLGWWWCLCVLWTFWWLCFSVWTSRVWDDFFWWLLGWRCCCGCGRVVRFSGFSGRVCDSTGHSRLKRHWGFGCRRRRGSSRRWRTTGRRYPWCVIWWFWLVWVFRWRRQSAPYIN